jgi:hypothetical protein
LKVSGFGLTGIGRAFAPTKVQNFTKQYPRQKGDGNRLSAFVWKKFSTHKIHKKLIFRAKKVFLKKNWRSEKKNL